MTYSTTTEFDLTGAGSGEVIEVQIEFDIEPGFAGSRHEPAYGAEAYNIAVTHWRLSGVSHWTEAADPLKCILEGCIDQSWLLEQADVGDDFADYDDWRGAAE
jgi:hypothetical protein